MGRPPACHCICGSEVCTGCELSSNLAKVEITFNGSFAWAVSNFQGTVLWNYVPSGISFYIYLEQYASDLTNLSGTIVLWKRLLPEDYALSSFTEYTGDYANTCRWYNDFPVIYQYVHHNSILSGNMEGELPGSPGQSVEAELEMVLAYVPLNYLDNEDPWNRQLKVVIDATGDSETIEFDSTSTWTVPDNTRRVMIESWGAGACGGLYETERSFLPAIDITNIGLWVAEGSSPLWQCINEIPVSNTDYIYSPVNAICTYETRLSNTALFPSPATNTFTLHYRMCKSDVDGNHSIDAVYETARPSGHVNEGWNVYNHDNINEDVYSPSTGDGIVCYTSPPQDLLIRASDPELDEEVLYPTTGDNTYLSYGPYSSSIVSHTFELQTTAITATYTNLSVWFYWRYSDASDDTTIYSVRLRSNGSYFTGTLFSAPPPVLTWAWFRADFTGNFTNPSLADYAVEISVNCNSTIFFDIDTLYLGYFQPDAPPYTRLQQWNLSTIDVPTAPSQYDLYIRWRVDSANYSNVTSVRVRINGSWYVFVMDLIPTDDTWIWSHSTLVGSFGSASSANYVVEITAVHNNTTGVVEVDSIYLDAKLEGAPVRATVSFGRVGTQLISTTHLLPTHPTDFAVTLTDSQKAMLLISPTNLYIKFVTTASGGISADQRGCSVFGARLAVTTPYVGTGGGGGGGYSRGAINLTPGEVYDIIIGEGGSAEAPDGGSTRLEKSGLPSPLLVTPGGKTANNLVGGIGGISGRDGGHGGTASITGGGGGSSAGVTLNGNPGGDGDGLGVIGGSGAIAPPEGGKGGKGGTDDDPPEDGEYPGGGGGGLGALIVSPGKGADGKLRITHQPGGRCGICVVDSYFRPPLPNAGDVICVAGDYFDDVYYGWRCTNSHLETSVHLYIAWGYPPYHIPGVYCTLIPRNLISSTVNKVKYWVLDTEINIARAVNRTQSAHPLGTQYVSPVVTVSGFANGDNNHQQFSLSGVIITVRFAKTVDCVTDVVGEEIELAYSNKFTGIADPEILTSIPSSVTMVLL